MSSTVPSRIQWSDILNESVYTSDDDVDIGDVAKGEKIGYTDTPAQTEEHIMYICDPCYNQFKNKEELSRHMCLPVISMHYPKLLAMRHYYLP